MLAEDSGIAPNAPQGLTVAVTTASQPALLCSSLHSLQFILGVMLGREVRAIRPIRQPGHCKGAGAGVGSRGTVSSEGH